MNWLYVAVSALAVLAALLWIASCCCFDDNDPDLDWSDNYADAERPHIELNNQCRHNGEKTDVVYWAAATVECVKTICDACGETLKTRIEH